MKNWWAIGIFLLPMGCGAEPEFIKFQGLRIPLDNVLHALESNLNDLLDDENTSIAIVIPEEEIKGAVSEYQLETSRIREVSFLIHRKALKLEQISESVLSTKANSVNEEIDIYLPYTRLYRSPESWLLVSENDQNRTLVAQCRRTGIAREVDLCEFRANLNGFGVSYDLRNNNISLSEDFKEFLTNKLESWLYTEN